MSGSRPSSVNAYRAVSIARTQIIIDFAAQSWDIRQQMPMIIHTAHLYTIDLRQQLQFVPKRAQIFERRGLHDGSPSFIPVAVERSIGSKYRARRAARDLAEFPAYWPSGSVFELQHVDLLQQNLPVNQPFQIAVAEFGNRVRVCAIRSEWDRPVMRTRNSADAQLAASSHVALRCDRQSSRTIRVQLREMRHLAQPSDT